MSNHQEIDPMLTTGEVAQLLHVHINTVRRWSDLGLLGTRGDRRFHREDVIRFLSQKEEIADSGAELEFTQPVD